MEILSVNCPACGDKNAIKEFVKEKFTFKRCKNCDTLYISPRPKQDKLLEYYKNSKSIDFFTKEILEKTANIRKKKIFLPRAKKVLSYIEKLNIPRGLFVEIGGGNGIFLEVMQELKANFQKYLNIEPSKTGALLTRKRGFSVINDFVENVAKLNADCICAFELIEHVFDPYNFCLKINKLLKKHGVFILTTPNIEGFDFIILSRNSDNIGGPNHLNYFNMRSIEILLKRTGFSVIEIETPGMLDVDIVYNKSKKYKIKDKFINFLITKRVEVLPNFQKFLQENKLSSNMMVVAQKI
ncbi:MAG: class I SAM-dependent methyltransferase [Candidatus Aenigmatarchaeota archaeon]